jgi:hypothetical protein
MLVNKKEMNMANFGSLRPDPDLVPNGPDPEPDPYLAKKRHSRAIQEQNKHETLLPFCLLLIFKV